MDKKNFELDRDKNQILASINSDVYDLDVVYGACYNFVDQAYIYLDGDPEEEIEVRLKGKEKMKKKELEDLAGEFLNELVNVGLRYRISEKNKKLREYVVSTALAGASAELKHELAEKQLEEADSQKEDDDAEWLEDPEGITVPWEEKYASDSQGGKNKKEDKPYKKNEQGEAVPVNAGDKEEKSKKEK